MTIETIRSFLVLSTVINYGILMIWFLLLLFAHDRIFTLHRVWFKLTNEQFNVIQYAGLGMYKIGILLFNLVPLIAISMLSWTSGVAAFDRNQWPVSIGIGGRIASEYAHF